MAAPVLIPVNRPRSPAAAVLVLHGGGSRENAVAVSPTQLSVLRMRPIARRVARAGRGHLAVYRLLNSTRGWDTHHTPVEDVKWALEQVRAERGDLPVGLVGHSLGGRAALLAGDAAGVRSIVALAPWVYPTDVADLSGRRVLIVHGSHDRVARLDRAEALARALSRTADVGFVCVEGGSHAMLRHHRKFDGYAAAFTAAVLLPEAKVRVPGPVQQALAGRTPITV